jgi:hypothetical protein
LENQEGCKWQGRVKAVLLLLAVLWGGAIYAKLFSADQVFWPLFAGGCAITFLLIAACYLAYAGYCEAQEKKQKKREKELLQSIKAEKELAYK